MGEFYYSSAAFKLTVERVDVDLRRLNTEIFGTKFQVERAEN